MWRMSAPHWHGIARADVFLTAAGPQVCELNSDTPSGEPEAVALNRVVDGAGAAGFDDPNCRLGDRVFAMVRAFLPAGHPLTVGIVYPTEMTDDLSVISLYARWFESRGARVVLGSPFNLRPDGRGGVALFGVSCSVIWRHYKTDWWGERRTIWRSESPYADAAPLSEPLELLAGAIARGRCVVVNPFGAVLTQNKRMMALLWEEIDRLSEPARQIVRRYLPYTARLEALAAHPPARGAAALGPQVRLWMRRRRGGHRRRDDAGRLGGRSRGRASDPLDRSAPVSALPRPRRAIDQLRRLPGGRPRRRASSRACSRAARIVAPPARRRS